MIYKFKSKATGDLIMLGPNGDQALRLMGREPASQGIIEPDAMPAALAALQAAITAQEAQAGGAAVNVDGDGDDDEASQAGKSPTLRQRLWPLMDSLRRAHEAGVPLVWGV